LVLPFAAGINSATQQFLAFAYRIATKIRAGLALQRLTNATLNSFRGLRHAFRKEAAFRQEAVALALAIPVGGLLAPSLGWYVAMIGSVLAVMAVELLNTSIEKLSDHVTPVHHPAIGVVKDYGSAAVFCGLAFAGLVWTAALAIRVGLL
jgi:diacylglycerol kinase (ATP)